MALHRAACRANSLCKDSAAPFPIGRRLHTSGQRQEMCQSGAVEATSPLRRGLAELGLVKLWFGGELVQPVSDAVAY